MAGSNNEDLNKTGESEYVEYEDVHPPRVEGRKGIEGGILYAPRKVQRMYKETLQALNARSPILTGMGLRTLVETICEKEKADGSSLFKKIDDWWQKTFSHPRAPQSYIEHGLLETMLRMKLGRIMRSNWA